MLANSDSEKDQEQKLRVRDAVIEVLKPVLEGAQDNLESKERIIKNMETIEHTAKKVAGEYPVTISMLKDYFPKITYGDFLRLWNMNIEPLLKEYLRGFRKSDDILKKFRKAYFNSEETPTEQEESEELE